MKQNFIMKDAKTEGKTNISNNAEVEKLADLVYKLVTHKGIDEKDRDVIDKIVEKREEGVY